MKQKKPFSLTPDIKQKLDAYSRILLEWNRSINLIAKSTESDFWQRHFEDSIQLENFIPSHTKSVLDVGSGAGFPGLVLAITRPDLEVTLVESDHKKTAFLMNVSRETNSPVKIFSERLEKIAPQNPDLITARAFAPLDKLLELCSSQINNKTEFLLLKGGQVEEELANAKKMWEFEHQIYPSKTDKSGVILHIQGAKKHNA